MEVPPWISVLLVIAIVTPRLSGMYVANSYRDIYGHAIQSADRDEVSGQFVVASKKNVIAKLSEDLSLLQVETVEGRKPTAVFIKNVVIDEVSKTVLLCSTKSEGSCEIRSLDNLDKIIQTHPIPIVPKNMSLHTTVIKSSSRNQFHFANDFINNVPSSIRKVPTISSRDAKDLNLVSNNMNGSSSKTVLSNLPVNYLVQYIYSFSHGNYIYFISRQSKSLSAADKLITKISRICVGDKYYRSFVEVPLDCVESVQTQFPHILSAYFDRDTRKLYTGFTRMNDKANGVEGPSALCVFEVNSINKWLDKAVKDCYNGEGGRLGPAHFHRTASCPKTNASVDLCGQSVVSEAYPSIEGETRAFQRPLIVLQGTRVTSLIAKREPDYAVVYMGTSNGSVKKVTVAANGFASVVSQVNLDPGHMIKSPMFLTNDGLTLYAMTESKLMQVSVDHCEDKTTCSECTASLDSVCGWCVLENRCMKEERCPAGGVSPSWLPSENGVCAEMKDIYPSILSYENLEKDSDRKMTFKLDRISVMDSTKIDLHCSFVVMGTKHVTKAAVEGDKISCQLPERAHLPLLPDGVVRTLGDNSILEVEFQILGKTIVKRDVSLYDCRVNQKGVRKRLCEEKGYGCKNCTESTFGCKWCHESAMCVENTALSCFEQTVAAIENPSSCPRLETSASDSDIVVHSGHTKEIAVKVANLQPDQMSNIHCLFTYEGEVKFSKGSISNSNLLCEPLVFAFNDTGLPIVTATFTVTAGTKSVPIDNPQNIKVRIYKCGSMVTNCGRCLTMGLKYLCGWCTEATPQCSLRSECQADQWLSRSSTCPEPKIHRFNPLTGPVQGKTNISVHGVNLGMTSADIEVTVAGIPCIVQSQQYESSQRFVCQIEGPKKPKEGVFNVTINNKYKTSTTMSFKFVDPVVTSFKPKKGPMAGGTILYIEGEHVNAGTMKTVDVGGGPCEVIKANSTVLECRTSQHVSNDNKVDIEVNFGNRRKLLPEKFTYVKNPEISMIEPKKTILSGGTSITAMGNRMQYIQNPEFFIEFDGQQIKKPCIVQTLTTWLVCKTPGLNTNENVTETNPIEVHYGFYLDGISTFKNISKDPNFGPLLYYPDPVVDKFQPRAAKPDELLVIKGDFKRVNPLLEDVRVTVGGTECSDPKATDDSLSCKGPENPSMVDSNGNAVVLLKIGNMQKEVGYISYFEKTEEDKPIAVGIILGVVLPILAIIILLTICVIRRHRKHKPDQDYIPDVWKDTEAKQDEEEEIGMNHVSVKADMNGSIPDDKDVGPYIEELLSKIEDDTARQNAKMFIISRKNLDVGDLLGKGNFGVTYKATYSESAEDKTQDVAVKTLQGSQTDSGNVAKFLETVTSYKDFQHDNVARITGVCITMTDDPMIVIPYSQNGDLKSYVRDSNRSLTVLELLEFGHQVSEGMAYLDFVHIAHGNLALRNCLITSDKKVQISDYGLYKDLFKKESHFVEDDKMKPLVKWAAPETIETVEFNSKSDVWSYGVVLWEILTRGVTPYPDVETADLKAYLEGGSRMKKPRQCPENIYELMLKCWTIDPESRPSFPAVSEEIQTFTSSESEEHPTGDGTPLNSQIEVTGAGEML